MSKDRFDPVSAIARLEGCAMTDTQRPKLPDALYAELERFSEENAELWEALRIFCKAAYPVASEINSRRHNWSEAYLDSALKEARALLAKLGGNA